MHSTDPKLTTNFWLWEFYPPEIYNTVPHAILMRILDRELVNGVQYFRTKTGLPTYINTWKNGGHYVRSGFRPWLTSIGAEWSMHKFARAADLKVARMAAPEVQAFIRKYSKEFLAAGITRVEITTPSWTHVDAARTLLKYLHTFKPAA